MKKKKLILIIIIFVSLITISCFSVQSYGFGVGDLNGTAPNASASNSLEKAGNGVVKVISTVGIFASIIFLVILGIKYMVGSTEEKAEYKKSLIPYIIGAGLVFAASTIAQLFYNIATTINKI